MLLTRRRLYRGAKKAGADWVKTAPTPMTARASTELSSTPNARAIDRARQPNARHHTTGRSANPWTFAAILRVAPDSRGVFQATAWNTRTDTATGMTARAHERIAVTANQLGGGITKPPKARPRNSRAVC